MRRIFPWLALILFLTTPAFAAVDARMLRMPDVSATEIAFVYAGDIWLVPKTGGVARRLSTPKGEEQFPRFSSDGTHIAFSGNYDGNVDVYVLPTAGGLPRRVTHHPRPDRMLDWVDGDRSLLFASSMTSEKDRFNKIYRVAVDGGLPEQLPMPYGEFAALGPDGKTLAYMPNSREFRTWKRYRGGSVSEIWLFDLEDHSWRDFSNHESNDSQPMWHGSKVYFLSDRDENQRGNLWVTDLESGETRQVTDFAEHDVRFPAIGPDSIVFENAGRLYLLDLATEKAREVEVDVVTDRSTLRPRAENVSRLIANWGISPSAKRAVFEARGEVFTVPAEHGIVRNLTRSSGVAERFPAWSPDGETIAYFSDRSGEYELTVRAADGSGDETTLTRLGPGFRYHPEWSPDSRKIAFVDEAMYIHVYDFDRDEVLEVDRGLFMFEGALQSLHFSWSSDSRWLAYHRALDNATPAVFLYDVEAKELHQLTSGFYSALFPSFDPEGKYLYMLWGRSFSPIFSDLQFSWLYVNTTQVAAVPLRDDVPSPLAPRNDEEEIEEEEDENEAQAGDDEKKADGEDGEGDEDKPEPVEIDLEGFESRLVVLPARPGNYWNVYGVPGKVLYQRFPRTGAGDQSFGFGGQPGDIVYFDLEEREEKTVVAAADGFELTSGGDKLLVHKDRSFSIVGVQPDQKLDKKLATGGLEMILDPPAEWRQLFDDAWRLTRDYFYDPGMHGTDWEKMRQRYRPLLDDAVTRWDVNFVIGELIAELNASHTYRFGGDIEQAENRGIGLLGADFALEDGAYRIANIVDLAIWESGEVRSPLRQPGVDVDEGDYLLAVNGTPVDVAKDPWAAFAGLAGETVMLTVNDRPTLDGAREVLVEPLEDEGRLRNLAWIERNRQRVDEATGGRVGYVYVPDTGINGHNELVRQFRAQFNLQGMIIDERFNSGGFGPDRMIELLDRPTNHYRAVRNGPHWQDPFIGHGGPKVMLINSWSGSGGDMLPWAFRQAGLGPLIGTRTWGGVIGISGAPALIDGGFVTVPSHGTYDPEGNWVMEGYGVDPDIEVLNDPTSMARGEDPQLARAISEILKMLEENPPQRPEKPVHPVIPGN